MIAAGFMLTKILATGSFGVGGLAGTCWITLRKFAVFGSALNSAGRRGTGVYGPLDFAAEYQKPLFSRYHVSWTTKTSQFVFTAKDSPGAPLGVRTGSPSNTTKLASRSA